MFFELIQNRKGNLEIWKKPLWKLIPCVEVTLVAKFYSILCLVAQESRLKRKGSVLNKNCAQFWVDPTILSRFPDKSETIRAD
jgi:hypothetical protein